MEKHLASISKYLSFILRHKPESIGLALDDFGWADIDSLIAKTMDYQLTPEVINLVVQTNDKQRFVIDESGKKIRANQGHSIEIDLNLAASIPPRKLLHGTASRFYDAIQVEGLTKQKRHHVHLTECADVAESVGGRYGKPILLEIDTKEMVKEGYLFYKTANHVWLVSEVPSKFLNRKR